jgi:Bcr/CflA subfamily drug resistance transporter
MPTPPLQRTAPRFATLVLLSGLSVVSLNLFLPSLPAIAADFGADYALVSLAVAVYAAMSAALQLIMGPLSDRYGRRPVVLAVLLAFCLASLGCLLAPDIWSFLGFRLLQAAIVSGYTVSLAIVRDTTSAQRAASLMGYMAMAWALAPMLGPMLGGVIESLFGWRASFLALLGFGLALFVLCWFDLGETNRRPTASFRAQILDYPALLRAPRFWAYALCMAFSIGAFYAFLSGAPLVATGLYGLPPSQLGLAISAITAGFVVGSFFAGRFAGRHALAATMLAGRLVACGGLCLGLALMASGFQHMAIFFGACIFVGLGNGITLPSANAGALSVRPQLAGSAAGLSGALTLAGGALFSAMTGWFLTAVGTEPGLGTGAPTQAAEALLLVMLAAAGLSLAAALAARHLTRREGGGG